MKREHFEGLAHFLGMTETQSRNAFQRLIDKKPLATDWIHRSFLSHELKKEYLKVLENRYHQLELN